MATQPGGAQRHGFERPAHHKKLAVVVLALIAVVVLLVIGIGNQYIERRDAEARMRAELQQRTTIATQMRTMISSELEAARAILVARTLQKVAEGKLAEARTELAPFASLQDPQIVQIMALIDKELAIRKSLEQGRLETTPAK